ncbi:MAG: mechanosensitive ion channel domain-containing protein [Halobacteriales archaeon]
MILAANASAASAVDSVLREFLAGIVGTLPRLLSGVIFLTLAYVAIKIALAITRSIFDRIYPPDQDLVVDLAVVVVGLFLWFGVVLALLKIVGMGDIAASLGTATGFIALGIAFALKEMIADTVAGIYLLKDPDFEEGDAVTTASVTGTVVRIDLRKTRIRAEDGDLVVLANRDVEKKWVKEALPEE